MVGRDSIERGCTFVKTGISFIAGRNKDDLSDVTCVDVPAWIHGEILRKRSLVIGKKILPLTNLYWGPDNSFRNQVAIKTILPEPGRTSSVIVIKGKIRDANGR
jgi:hypothetical protein